MNKVYIVRTLCDCENTDGLELSKDIIEVASDLERARDTGNDYTDFYGVGHTVSSWELDKGEDGEKFLFSRSCL